MDELIPVLLILAGFYVGWNIGANDAANCIGTTVGARIVSYRKAVAIMAVFVILGGVLQGHHVMKTVGKGIVISEAQVYEDQHGVPPPAEFSAYFPDDRLPDNAILVALLSAGFFVTLATFSKVPVSTSQAIVGGVAGVGLGVVGLQADYFKIAVIFRIVGAWLISPVLTMILAFGLYWILGRLLRRMNSVLWTRAMGMAVLASAAYVSYSLGANDVGNAIGPLLSKYPDKGLQLAVLGGVAMAIGAITAGGRVTDTVGKSITGLDYGGALAAQLSAGIGVHLFSMAGIPVSTSQAVVGGVIGVGLTKGARAVSTRKIVTIMTGWVVTPVCAALFAAMVFRIFFQ
jgi:PiT family inorganic phosphate transporter